MAGGWTKGQNRNRTFEGDDDNFLLAIPTPFLNLTKRIDKHARINDDDVGLFSTRFLGVLGPALPRRGRTLPLLVLVLVLLMGLCSGGGDSDTTDGELPPLRIIRRLMMWALAITPVSTVVSVVVSRGSDGLFELLDLV
jgi:hypothetical protein